jgi:cation diffusion facilitator CzcD-associated flavoprotein CzcO
MARQLGGTDDELLDVVVIGGSQAGLAMAWNLARQHLPFAVLEAGPEPGHTRRSCASSRIQRSTRRAMSSPGCWRPTRSCMTETQTLSGGPGITAWHRRVTCRTEASVTPIGGSTAIRARGAALAWGRDTRREMARR